MHSPGTNNGTKGGLNISHARPRFGSTKLASGAPVCAARGALTLAVLSALLLMIMMIVAARPAQAQTETVLYNFCTQLNCTDGRWPTSGLTSDGAGNLYGTTIAGSTIVGAPGSDGIVFELSPNGSGGWNYTVIYDFCSPPNCADGWDPGGSLIFDSVGNLYGTAGYGGANGWGVAFELSPVGTSWTETVLYNFCTQAGCADGAAPLSGLIMDKSGNLYGTTYCCSGQGVVFELIPSGSGWTEQVIYNTLDPTYAGLTMDAAGNIFGTTVYTVFELSPNGNGGWNPTVIHTFAGGPKDGYDAEGTPVLDQAGNLYGTTARGGDSGKQYGGYGTAYKLSPPTKKWQQGKWTEKILHSFAGGRKDGSYPWAGTVFDAAGNIYSSTLTGGQYGDGTVFELVAPVGMGSHSDKILWSFKNADGAVPQGSLVLDSAGHLYGTTNVGGLSMGLSNFGVVFEVTPPACWTTTTLTSSPNPSAHGQAVTFTAVVTCSLGAPPNGETVTFMKGAKVLGTGSLSGGSATFTTSTLPVGTNSITAVYGGDARFGNSTSKVVKQVVN